MKPAMRIVCAVCLAVAMLAGGNARAEDLPEGYTAFGESCINWVKDDVFDGKLAIAWCKDNATQVEVVARCKNNTTDIFIDANKYMLKDGLRLRTALDGVETPEWSFGISANYEALFIDPAISTIKEVLRHSRLHARIIERDGDQHNGDIDISRFGEAIKPVRALCGW